MKKGVSRWDFATEQEAEYPEPLCTKVADLLTEACSEPGAPRGKRREQPIPRDDPNADRRRELQTAAGQQPRRGQGA